MKKILVSTIAALTMTLAAGTAYANPSCIMLRFEDDTRFDKIETTGTLSDLILEKLVSSGKFNFKETKPIDESIEKKLYDERANELENLKWSLKNGDYNKLFEGPGFNESRAQSIATANLGQIVSPDIIKGIGQQHGAEYIIQGTIINLGSGDWTENKIGTVASTLVGAISGLGSVGAANFLGPVGAIASAISVKKGTMGVQADVRVIKANSGEVVWQKRVTGLNVTKQIGVGFVKVGTTKLNNEMYFKAVDDAASKIANTLIEDASANTLFVK